jgi:hypothetical protein
LSGAVQAVYAVQGAPPVALNELTHEHVVAPTALPVSAGHGMHVVALLAAGVNVLAGHAPHVWSALLEPAVVTC